VFSAYIYIYTPHGGFRRLVFSKRAIPIPIIAEAPLSPIRSFAQRWCSGPPSLTYSSTWLWGYGHGMFQWGINIYIYVCVYVCMYLCMCVYACMYVCICQLCVYIYTVYWLMEYMINQVDIIFEGCLDVWKFRHNSKCFNGQNDDKPFNSVKKTSSPRSLGWSIPSQLGCKCV
jgi:hypothetical protein